METVVPKRQDFTIFDQRVDMNKAVFIDLLTKVAAQFSLWVLVLSLHSCLDLRLSSFSI